MRSAAALAERLGLPVRDLELFEQALIHSSYLYEHRDLAAGHNERLEFLGDSVVSLVISDALFRRYPGDNEGVLSARRASIVSTAGLARLASRLGLGEYLLLGEGESQRGGRRRPALLASGLEALVGAVYLDLGFAAATEFVLRIAAPELASDRPAGALKSPKSRLQEFTQRLSGERPQYRLLDALGPDHDKLFRVEVAVGGRVIGLGEGRSRRVAETAAAARALEVLRNSQGDLGERAIGAPELIEFGAADVSALDLLEEEIARQAQRLALRPEMQGSEAPGEADLAAPEPAVAAELAEGAGLALGAAPAEPAQPSDAAESAERAGGADGAPAEAAASGEASTEPRRRRPSRSAAARGRSSAGGGSCT